MKTKLWRQRTQRRWVGFFSERGGTSVEIRSAQNPSAALLSTYNTPTSITWIGPCRYVILCMNLYFSSLCMMMGRMTDQGEEGGRGGGQREKLVLPKDRLKSAAWCLLTHSWCSHGDSGDDHLRDALRCRSLPQRQTHTHTELISQKLTGEMPVFWSERSPGSRPWSCPACCRSRPSLQCHSGFPWKG